MIAWWWLPVAIVALWSALFAVILIRDEWARDSTVELVFTLVTAPLLTLAWPFKRLDVGAGPISARAVSRFADQRSADGRPAWLFWHRGHGILIVRSWRLGSDRPVARLRPEWQTSSSEEAR